MKISPVQGTPTIPNPASTGLSPDKLLRIKQIASNQPEKETNLGAISLSDNATSQTQTIKMSPNKTPQEILTQQEPQVDAPAVVVPDESVQAKSEPGATGTISPELAQIAKERRALQLKERELEERAKALEAQPTNPNMIDVERLKSSPLSVLQELGVTYEQLTNEILGNQSNNEIISLKQQLETLTKSVDEKFSQKDTQQEEAVYDYMSKEVDKLSNLQPYKLIRETKSQDKVMELIKRSWRENGDILTEEEAMNLIETELREDAKRYAKLIGELETPETPTEEEPAAPQVHKSVTKTLTNKDSARPVMSRRQRAIAAALGQK